MPYRITAHSPSEDFQLTGQAGPTLLEQLQDAGIPIKSSCLGKGLCRQCRVRVESGVAPITDSDRKSFSKALLDQGWRLSCGLRPKTAIEVHFPQAYTFQDSISVARAPFPGYSFVIDYGTTGVEIAVVDAESAANGPCAIAKSLNRQVSHGADIMTRLEYAQRVGVEPLRDIGRAQIFGLIDKLQTAIAAKFGEATAAAAKREILVAGNSAVSSFLANLDVSELAVSPYQPATREAQSFAWTDARGAEWNVRTLPLLNSFVGGDLFAGLFLLWREGHIRAPDFGARGENARNWLFMDVGTNSEILYWDGKKLFVSSTPAGPAFEGSNISIGMRAERGAIVDPRWNAAEGRWNYRVIGGDLPKGICGSALIQSVHEAVRSGAIAEDGEVLKPEGLRFIESLALSQDDVREFQLAKSAIRTGLELVVEEGSAKPEVLFLGGAFGENLPIAESRAIGLLPALGTEALGNTSLRGAILWEFATPAERIEFTRWLDAVKTPIELALSDRFQEVFVKNMTLSGLTPKVTA